MTQIQLVLGICYVISNQAEMLLFAYNSCEDSYYAKAKTWERWWKSASHLSNTDLKWILRKTSFTCKCLIQLSLIMTFLSQARWVVHVLCTVRYNLTHLTLRKASCFVSGCSGNMQNRKLIFSHCFTHLWDSPESLFCLPTCWSLE